MKVCLIAAGNLWSSPFVRIYTRLLDSLNVEYDIVSWNRDGSDKKEGIQFEYHQDLTAGAWSKVKSFWQYSRFVTKVVKENGYDRLIVFNPQTAIIIYPLLRKYRKRYIFDYRDLSIEQNKYLKGIFKKILKGSAVNFISSPGFKKALPDGYEYQICHNFNAEAVKKALDTPLAKNWKEIHPQVVLTIGALRDYGANVKIIKSLAHKSEYKLLFVGKGPSSESLKKYCEDNKIENAEFVGYYQKEEEEKYIIDSSFLNIFYPRLLSHDTALSNRFYNSLIYKRPMIVTSGTTQGDFTEEYNVGVAINNADVLDEKLKDFIKQDFSEYASRCNALLARFLKEQRLFEQTVASFVGK